MTHDKAIPLTGKLSMFLSKLYITVALTVCASGSHLAIPDAISMASRSLAR